MENASKALLMAGSMLIGILILTLMVTLFISSRDLSKGYEQNKQSETVQQFNANFIKYLGQDLTVHQVLTIYNFAKQNRIEESDISSPVGFSFTSTQITEDLNQANMKLESLSASGCYKVEKIYQLTIIEYDPDTGYVSKIKFTHPTTPKAKFKCYTKDALGNIEIFYDN